MNAGGILYDRMGSYWPVYFIALIAAAAWTAALLVAGPRHQGLARRVSRTRGRVPV
jgi:hypothetical protein